MKLVLSLVLALASSTVAAAAPASADPVHANVQAPSAETLVLARKFVALTDPADAIVEMFRVGFWQGVSKSIDDEATMAEAKVGIDGMLARLEPRVRASAPRVLEAYAQVYAREFTFTELQQMIAFAESPAGRHYLSGYAKLDGDERVVEATAEMMESLAPLLDDLQKEMCAAKAAKRVAMGDKDAACPLSAPPTLDG